MLEQYLVLTTCLDFKSEKNITPLVVVQPQTTQGRTFGVIRHGVFIYVGEKMYTDTRTYGQQSIEYRPT